MIQEIFRDARAGLPGDDQGCSQIDGLARAPSVGLFLHGLARCDLGFVIEDLRFRPEKVVSASIRNRKS